MSEVKKVNNKFKAVAVSLAAVLLLAPLSFLFFVNVSYANKIYSGVSVCGISLGGMTREEALTAITAEYQSAALDKDIDLVFGEKRRAVGILEHAAVDLEATVSEALDVGRAEAFLENLALIFGERCELSLVVEYDAEAILNSVKEFAGEAENERSAVIFSEDGTTAKIDMENGILVDIQSTAAVVKSNFSNMNLNDVELMLMSIDDVNELQASHDSTRILDLLYESLNREPSDADYEITDNEIIIHDEKPGSMVNRAELERHLSVGERSFEVAVELIAPQKTKEHLEAEIFKDVLSTYTTNFALTMPGRTRNITLAADKVNNTVIAPGEIFSFNRVVGQRTYAAGFQDANVYNGGKLEQGVGGGICQVSSTLYTASLLANLEIVTRYNHMFTVSYLPLGQDATVSWGTIDFEFKNNTAHPIKVKASVSGGVHNVQILGTKDDPAKTVKLVNQTISTRATSEKIEISDSLEPGKTVVLQAGQSGATVDSYRVHYKNGVEESREFLHRSTYSPMERIVQKSSREASEEQPSTEAEEPAEGQSMPTAEHAADEQNAETAAEQAHTPSNEAVSEEMLSENGI